MPSLRVKTEPFGLVVVKVIDEKNGVILSFRESPPTGLKPGDGDTADDKIETETPRLQPKVGFTRHDTSKPYSSGH